MIIFLLSIIDIPIGIVKHTSYFCFTLWLLPSLTIRPFTFVNLSIWKEKGTFAINFVIYPLPLVYTSVRIVEFTLIEHTTRSKITISNFSIVKMNYRFTRKPTFGEITDKCIALKID